MSDTKPAAANASNLKFLSIKDQSIISKIFDVTTVHQIQVTTWLKSQTLRFDSFFAGYQPKFERLFLAMPPKLTQNELNAAIATQGTKEMLGSFQVQTVNFFFRTLFLNFTETGNIQIQIPKELFKLQRRQNLRIAFDRKAAPKITMFHPNKEFAPQAGIINDMDIVAFRVLDVSTGGVGFAAKAEDAHLFPKDKVLHDMRFKLRGVEVVTEGTIAHTLKTTNDKGQTMLKIGVKFLNLKPNYANVISNFTLEESRNLFSLL